jgi:hypothetical protein
MITSIILFVYFASLLGCRWFDRKNPEMKLTSSVWLCPAINTLFLIMIGIAFIYMEIYMMIEDIEAPKFVLYIRNKITKPISNRIKKGYDWFFNNDIRR